MPVVLRIDGHRFFFWSSEALEPPHIHVEKAGNYARFWLSPVALADSIGHNARELTRLRRLVEAHAALFREK
jgi:hypothetical protein